MTLIDLDSPNHFQLWWLAMTKESYMCVLNKYEEAKKNNDTEALKELTPLLSGVKTIMEDAIKKYSNSRD